jgi:hypothetical protein
MEPPSTIASLVDKPMTPLTAVLAMTPLMVALDLIPQTIVV